MQTKTLSERIAEIINIKKNLTEFYSVNELKTQAAEEKKVIDEYAGLIADRFILGSYIDLIDEVLPLVTELQAKNAALLAKNKELEMSEKHWHRKYRDRTDDNLKFRKDNEDLEAKVKELEKQLEIWKENYKMTGIESGEIIAELSAEIKELEGKMEIAQSALERISNANSDGYVFDADGCDGVTAAEHADKYLNRLNKQGEKHDK